MLKETFKISKVCPDGVLREIAFLFEVAGVLHLHALEG
jgi:hypothetical protein